MSKKEDIKIVQEDIKKYSLLEAVERSEGGQMILLGLKKDAVGAIDKLISCYKTASDVELRTWCAILGERMNLIRMFKNKSQKKFAIEALDELLKSPDDDS